MSPPDAKSNESKRKQVRYAVSDDCRVRASIRLQSSDPGTAKKEWTGTLVDLSAAGAHIQISLGAVAYTGDGCVLSLAHGGVKTEVRGTLAHYVCSARHSVCGLRFDHAVNQGYEPFFKAVVASGGLTAGPAGTESAGRHREEYCGRDHAKLVVWRDQAGGVVLAFDYTMGRYAAALETVGADMFKNKEQVRFKAADGSTLTRAQEVEARWEFSLAASNLPKAIAPDIRRLLRLVS